MKDIQKFEDFVNEGKLNEAEKYDLNFKKGDTIDLLGDTWEIIGDMKSRKKFKYPFTFRGEDMQQLPITAPSTSKNAEGYKVRTVEGRGVTSVSPMYGFLYQYTSGGKFYTKLAIKDVPQNESVNESVKPIYKKGQKVEYRLEHKGGVGKYANAVSKSKDTDTGVIKKKIKTLSSFKYELTSGLEIYQSEIIGLSESIDESHDLNHPVEMENNRMMQSSAAEFTKYLMRKAQESMPQNFQETHETLILPINELTFNDLNGNPSKISKEIASIIQKALPSNVLKRISELEPNYNETMASPHDASKKGVGTGFVEYKGIGVILKDPKPGKLSSFTVGIRKRTSGPGTGYIAIKGSIKKKNSMDHQLPIGNSRGNYSEAAEFWVDGMAEDKLKELFNKYLAKYM